MGDVDLCSIREYYIADSETCPYIQLSTVPIVSSLYRTHVVTYKFGTSLQYIRIKNI